MSKMTLLEAILKALVICKNTALGFRSLKECSFWMLFCHLCSTINVFLINAINAWAVWRSLQSIKQSFSSLVCIQIIDGSEYKLESDYWLWLVPGAWCLYSIDCKCSWNITIACCCFHTNIRRLGQSLFLSIMMNVTREKTVRMMHTWSPMAWTWPQMTKKYFNCLWSLCFPLFGSLRVYPLLLKTARTQMMQNVCKKRWLNKLQSLFYFVRQREMCHRW